MTAYSKRKYSVCDESEENYREGVLMLADGDVFVQRYFTVYDHKISYSSRGRERSHDFTPLTRVYELTGPKYFPFKVETEGQKSFVLGAESQEDASDWIGSIKAEAIRMVVNILDLYENKGYGDYSGATQGGELNEGRYAGYVLRKQNEQVVPLFLSLNDGKLLVKREAKLKETVGTFRIGKSTSVEVLDNYACFAIALDKKEVIIMTSAAVRSNWLVAIRSAIQKLPPLARGAKYEEIDFGAPQRPTMRSMHLKKADLAANATFKENEDADFSSQFYTFVGSARISGTVRLRENSAKPPSVVNNLDTFRIVDDDEDDGQDKFLNMRLEFEDDTDDVDTAQDLTIVVDNEQTSSRGETPSFADQAQETPSSADSGSSSSSANAASSSVGDATVTQHQEQQQQPQQSDPQQQQGQQTPIASSKGEGSTSHDDLRTKHLRNGLNAHKRSESLDTGLRPPPPTTAAPLPIGLFPTPIRSSHEKSRKNIRKIRLTTKYPEGPIRVYGGVLRTSEQYKTLIVSSDTETSDVIQMMLGKYGIPDQIITDYVLVEEELHDPTKCRILDMFESPLLAKLNWEDRNLQFAIRTLAEVKNLEAKPKNLLRVRCIDGLRNMAFNINENLASSRVASLVGEKLQIGKDPKYSQDLIKCFSLWMQTEQFGITFENQLELQLEPHQQMKVLNEEWPELVRKFIALDPSDPTPAYEIVFKRWAFLSVTVERRIRDPAAVSLLCEQAMFNVHRGVYVFSEEEAVYLCAVRAQLMLKDYNPEVHVPGYLLRHTDDFKDMLPSFITSAFKKDEFEAKVLKEFQKLKAYQSDFINHLLFLQCVRLWQFYGATFFTAQMISTNLKGSKRRSYIEDAKNKGQHVRVGVNCEGIHIIDPVKNVVLSSSSMGTVSIVSEHSHANAFFFEVDKIISKGTIPRRDREQTQLYGLFTLQAPLLSAYVTSALKQRDEDAAAERLIRNMQRKELDMTNSRQFYRYSVH